MPTSPRSPGSVTTARSTFSHRLNQTALAIENLPQITIAAINGCALGGGLEPATATDFRIAASDARLGQPEIQLGIIPGGLGIIPGGGGTQRLSRLAGITLAKELVYTGRHTRQGRYHLATPGTLAKELVYTGRHTASEEAPAANVISSIHEPDAVQQAAFDLTAEYAKGPVALHIAERVVPAGLHLPLDEAVAIEAEGFAEAFTTADKAIGVTSFMEHGPGKATFSGR